MYLYDVESFIGACARKGLAAKTLASYEKTLRMFGMFLEKRGVDRVEQIRHPDIEAYIDYILSRGKYTVCTAEITKDKNCPEHRGDYAKKVSAVTINNYLRNLKVFFNWCVQEELIRKSPVRANDTMKVERRPLAFITDEEFRQLLDCLDTSKFSEYRDSVIIRLLLDTGMRCGECLAVKTEHLNLQSLYIDLPADITKGRKGRVVFFSERTKKVLRHWLEYKERYRDSEYLFCANEGRPLQVNNFEANIRKYGGRIGLKNIHPHCFRNNFAKRFLLNGGDIYTLSRILGHSSVTVTEKAYLDVGRDDLRKLYAKYSPIENMRV